MQRTKWPNPPVVIQHGPMTNSSSSSYFVIAPPTAKLNLEVLDFEGRQKLALEDPSYGGDFNWYEHNKRLVRITPGEWASWCALALGNWQQREESMANIVRLKEKLDGYTKKILDGAVPYHLVANRDDNEIPPTHYNREDVSEDKQVVLIKAGEEH